MSQNYSGAGQADTMGIEYLDGLYGYAMALTPQPCKSRGSGTGDIRSRHTGNGKAACAQRCEGLALHYSEKYLAQRVEKAVQ